MFGLSKERPILGDHPKAHIHEIHRISIKISIQNYKSCRFHVKSGGFSPEIHPKPYKIRCFNKNSSVWGLQGGGYDTGFHEILCHSPSPAFIKLNSFGWNICFYKVLGGFHVKSKDHLQEIVTLCFPLRFAGEWNCWWRDNGNKLVLEHNFGIKQTCYLIEVRTFTWQQRTICFA